jgi:hypothetical protein
LLHDYSLLPELSKGTEGYITGADRRSAQLIFLEERDGRAVYCAMVCDAAAGISSLGRYVFGSEISYNKPPPRLPGLAC